MLRSVDPRFLARFKVLQFYAVRVGDGVSLSSRVVASRQQTSTEVDGEVVILNFDQGMYYGLDTVGAFVWKLLAKPREVEELRDAIVDEFDVPPDVCEGDLRELLVDLGDAGLIETVASDST